MATPSLQVTIVDQHKVQLNGQKGFTSYCIKVIYGDSSWFVYYADEQINKLTKQLTQPTIEGFLYKKAENWVIPKQWNKRYFKLVGTTLYYSPVVTEENIFSNVYKKIELAGAKVGPTYDLEKAVSNAQIPNEIIIMKGMFEIQPQVGKPVYLRAPTQGDMLRWVDALRGEKEESTRRQIRSVPAYSRETDSSNAQPKPVGRIESLIDLKSNSGSFFKKKDEKTSPTLRFSRAAAKTDFDIETFLQNLCILHQGSDILRSFLLVNTFNGDEFPQYRMMLEAIDNGDMVQIKKLHEEFGVPIIFAIAGKHSFMEACRLGRIRVVEYMFATEPESVMEPLLYKTDNFDQTALHYACFASLELSLLLISRSSVDKLVSMFGTWTPLHHLAKAAKVIHPEQIETVQNIVNALKKHINATDMVENYSPLHICAKENNTTLAIILLQNNAKYEILTHHGKTFLHLLVHNTSTKSHDMTEQVLNYLYKNQVNTMRACNLQLNFLECMDNENRAAIQCAFAKDPASPHIALLVQHYVAVENMKFKLIMSEILYIYSQPSASSINVLNTTIFQTLCELICSACSINEYHHDIPILIARYRELFARTEKSLLEVKISDRQKADFMDELLAKTYPFIIRLFIQKKAPVDFVLNQYLEVFKKTATRIGMGITEDFWRRAVSHISQEKPVKLGSSREGHIADCLENRAILTLCLITNLEKPAAKINCIKEVLAMFECQGDEDFSLLSYLMVRAQHCNIRWSAEIDYITTMIPVDKYSMLLKSIQMFFLSSWVHKITRSHSVVNPVEAEDFFNNILEGLKTIVEYANTIPSGSSDSLQLLALFFFLSQDTKQATLKGTFSRAFLSHPRVIQILRILQITFRDHDEGLLARTNGDISITVFARITASLFGLLQHQ